LIYRKVKEYIKEGAFLFPHVYISKGQLKRVLSHLSILKIGIPVAFQIPEYIRESEKEGRIILINLRGSPFKEQELKRSIDEIKSRKEFQDTRSLRDYLNYSIELDQEEHIWEIRDSIRGKAGEEDDLFSSHLILNLFAEKERNLYEAEEILFSLKSKDRLFDGIAEEVRGSEGILYDLPEFCNDSFLKREEIVILIGAWLSLFGNYLLDDGVPLLTLNKSIFEYLRELTDRGDGDLEEQIGPFYKIKINGFIKLPHSFFERLNRRTILFLEK